MRKLLLLILISLFCSVVFSQYAYRISADILTKTRLIDSTFQVSNGQFYYDKNNKQIIFDFTFPQKEKIVLFDTIMSAFRADTLFNRSTNFLIPEQSFFHFILLGKIGNFGLEESRFKAEGIEQKKDMVITTWVPPAELKAMISKIHIATKKKQLYSITMVGPDGKIINRQILKDYQLIDGLDIPHEILVATYLEKGAMFQIIKLSNVVLNELGNNQKYFHGL